jgi:hypothetical protein
MTKDEQNITRPPLGSKEADFLARIGTSGIFSLDDARQKLKPARIKLISKKTLKSGKSGPGRK